MHQPLQVGPCLANTPAHLFSFKARGLSGGGRRGAELKELKQERSPYLSEGKEEESPGMFYSFIHSLETHANRALITRNICSLVSGHLQSSESPVV